MILDRDIAGLDRSQNRPGPFYYHGLTSAAAWLSNHIRYKVWDEIAYPFPNFNSCAVDFGYGWMI